MNEFISRIGLGCGRLSGGVAERASRRLIDAALTGGIRYYDTAPSYGGGRAEQVLGRALQGMRPDVRICTKVGLARPSPTLKTELRSLLVGSVRRALPAALVAKLRRQDARARPAGERQYGRFDLAFVGESLERSAAALRSERLDAVLLHEPRLTDPPEDTRAMLQAMVGRHAIGELGAGTAQAADQLPQFGTLAQCTVAAALPADGREWIVHGLLRDFDPGALQAALDRSGLANAIPSLVRYMTTEQQGAGVLLCATLIGLSPRRVLLSTHSPSRLKGLLDEGAELFSELTSHPEERVAGPLSLLVREYLAGRRSVS